MVRETGAMKHHLLCIISAWNNNSFVALEDSINAAKYYLSRTETAEEIRKRQHEGRNGPSTRIYERVVETAPYRTRNEN